MSIKLLFISLFISDGGLKSHFHIDSNNDNNISIDNFLNKLAYQTVKTVG
jgi:hypothetical protein